MKVHVGGREIEVTHPDRVLWEDAGLTKSDLVDYVRGAADHLLAGLADRPLVLRRYPEGISAQGFFQKSADQLPGWVRRVTLDRREGGTVTHAVADDEATLVLLANLAAIELHTIPVRADRPDQPSEIILDLDPAGDDRAPVIEAIRATRSVLDELGVQGYVRSSGSRGAHVIVPLVGDGTVDAAARTARALAERVVRVDPRAFTTAHAKADRGGRLYVDAGRNGAGQHAVASYSPRALPGAPVAAPLDWAEATAGDFDPRRITVSNLFRRLSHKADPWADLDDHRIGLDDLIRRLGERDIPF